MGALFEYSKQIRRFAKDSSMRLLDEENLHTYINRSRREVAMRTQCLRVLTPISGQITDITVLTTGSGYTAPVVNITPPDFPSGYAPFPNGAQATAVANLTGTAVTGVNVTFGGAGYFQPLVTITDPTGTGATVSTTLTLLNQTIQGQEVYPFSGIDLSPFPGVQSIFAVKGVTIIYANYRFALPVYSFSTYNAKIRQYPYQYSWVPTIGAQYGRGTSGSFYLYPLASQNYQMEFDCFCLPSDLTSDQDFEPIPDPWTDGVPFLGAYYAFQELQNLNAAAYYKKEFAEWMTRYGQYSEPGRVSNPYGRYLWPIIASISSMASMASIIGVGFGIC